MVNSVNGKKEVMEAVFPLVRKYGRRGEVALCLDENGIPETAAGRLAVAKKRSTRRRPPTVLRRRISWWMPCAWL